MLLSYSQTPWKRCLYYGVVGWIIGTIVVVLYPHSRGRCSPPTAITLMATATIYPGLGTAFNERIAYNGLVAKARAAPGNLKYDLLQNVYDTDEFRFVETWESQQALQTWMAGLPQTIFGPEGDKYLQNMMVGGKLQLDHYAENLLEKPRPLVSAYMSARTVTEQTRGGMVLTVKSSCDQVWKMVGDWKNCEWVIGCTKATVQSDDKNIRHLEMPIGTITVSLVGLIDTPERKSIKYLITQPGGYTGNLTAMKVQATNECRLVYQFEIESGKPPWNYTRIMDDFHKNRIPQLTDLWSNISDAASRTERMIALRAFVFCWPCLSVLSSLLPFLGHI